MAAMGIFSFLRTSLPAVVETEASIMEREHQGECDLLLGLVQMHGPFEPFPVPTKRPLPMATTRYRARDGRTWIWTKPSALLRGEAAD